MTNLKEYCEQFKDMVTFYLGCSFTFEKALQKAGIPVRNVEQKCNVSMYKVRTEENNSKKKSQESPVPFWKKHLWDSISWRSASQVLIWLKPPLALDSNNISQVLPPGGNVS